MAATSVFVQHTILQCYTQGASYISAEPSRSTPYKLVLHAVIYATRDFNRNSLQLADIAETDEDLRGTGLSRPRQKPPEHPPSSEQTTGEHDLLEDPEMLMDTTPAVGGVIEDLSGKFKYYLIIPPPHSQLPIHVIFEILNKAFSM